MKIGSVSFPICTKNTAANAQFVAATRFWERGLAAARLIQKPLFVFGQAANTASPVASAFECWRVNSAPKNAPTKLPQAFQLKSYGNDQDASRPSFIQSPKEHPMFKPSIVDKLDEDLADALAKAAIGPDKITLTNGADSVTIYAPPIIRAPSASAESVRAAYEAAAVRAEQVAEELANLLTVERDSAIKLAAELRKVGDREAEAISKVCDRAAEAHKLLETLRKGLTEGAADSK